MDSPFFFERVGVFFSSRGGAKFSPASFFLKLRPGRRPDTSPTPQDPKNRTRPIHPKPRHRPMTTNTPKPQVSRKRTQNNIATRVLALRRTHSAKAVADKLGIPVGTVKTISSSDAILENLIGV